MKIFTRATVPDGLAHEWLQHLRDFDAAHPDCHFEVMADAPEMPLAQAVELVKVDPELSFSRVFARAKPAVHILHYGLPLCHFTEAAPENWPLGHKWTGKDGWQDATCCLCRLAHQMGAAIKP